MFQISPTTFAVTAGLTMFLFLSGMAIFMLIEMGVNNVGEQKQVVHLFMKHPWKVEILIIGLTTSFPIAILSFVFGAEDPSTLSLVGSLMIVWPIIMFVLHRRLMDFQQLLGIGRKKEYDSVLVAKANIMAFTIAVCGLVVSFILSAFDISLEISYLILGPSGMIMILVPFRKSLALVRSQNTSSDDEVE